MTKKLFVLVLGIVVCMLALLCGCSGSNVPSGNHAVESTSSGGESPPPTINLEKPNGQTVKQGEEPLGLKHEPVRDYYICSPKFNTTYDPDTSGSFRLRILSVEPIPLEELQVQIACQSDFRCTVSEIDLTLDENKMPYYLYCCYAGLDWVHLASLADPQAQGQSAEFNAYYDSYIDAYLASENSGFLQWDYHVYNLYVIIETFVEEEITEMEIFWPGVTTHVDLGSIRIKEESHNSVAGVDFSKQWPVEATVGGASGFFLSGMTSIARTGTPIWGVRTLKDIYLNRLWLLEGWENGCKIHELRLVLTNEANPQDVTDMVWDGATPIFVSEGYLVECYAVLENSMFTELNQDGNIVTVAEYQCGDEVFVLPATMGMDNVNGQYAAQLALYLDGVDVMSYYRDFCGVMYALQ